MTSASTIEIEIRDGVGTVRMNHGAVNAIDLDYARLLSETLAGMRNREDLRALILTGTGGAFSAGLDLRLVPHYGAAQQRELVDTLNQLFGSLYDFPVPTIAAVNGHAIAGGMVLALACDYRLCVLGKAVLGLTEVRVGVPYPVSAIEIARRELPPNAARNLVLLGRTIDPATALAQGVVDETVPHEELLDRASAVADELRDIPLSVYQRVKRQLRRGALTRIGAARSGAAEPMLDAWLTDETAAAAARMLAPRG